MAMPGASLIRFPTRAAACIWIVRDGAAWLVLARDHGWLHGSFHDALADARWLADNLSLPIRH